MTSYSANRRAKKEKLRHNKEVENVRNKIVNNKITYIHKGRRREAILLFENNDTAYVILSVLLFILRIVGANTENYQLRRFFSQIAINLRAYVHSILRIVRVVTFKTAKLIHYEHESVVRRTYTLMYLYLSGLSKYVKLGWSSTAIESNAPRLALVFFYFAR